MAGPPMEDARRARLELARLECVAKPESAVRRVCAARAACAVSRVRQREYSLRRRARLVWELAADFAARFSEQRMALQQALWRRAVFERARARLVFFQPALLRRSI